MAEIEMAFQRITTYNGVLGIVVIGANNEIVRTNMDAESSESIAQNIPGLVQLGGYMVRELDSQNDLKFLRLKLAETELMIAPYPDFSIIVLRDAKIHLDLDEAVSEPEEIEEEEAE